MLQPGLDARMQLVAVRTAVPEEFDDFYIVSTIGWLRMGQDRVIRPSTISARARKQSGNLYRPATGPPQANAVDSFFLLHWTPEMGDGRLFTPMSRAKLPYVPLHSFMHFDETALHAVLLQGGANPVHVINVGKRSYTYACQIPFSGRSAAWTVASTPSIASFAFRLSASPAFWNDPA